MTERRPHVSSDESITRTDDAALHLPDDHRTRSTLTVAHHPEAKHVGVFRALRPGERLVLGRGADAFGPDVLRDPLLSKQHVAVEGIASGLRVADLGSRNGSFLNGALLSEAADLRPGDVLAIGSMALVVSLTPLHFRPRTHPRLLGGGAAISRVIERIALAAPRSTTLLVRGETGTGKELVARAIHEQSGRTGAFVAVNCGALADGVVHSELFGHASGAFSGAGQARTGLVGAAAGGTLFLDEIGDASPALQASLLRLLEQREYRPVGSDRVQRTDARFITATHVDLTAAVRDGTFRADLLGRIRRASIELTPLRERREDIGLLALAFAARHAGEPLALDRPLAMALLCHDWPANVRELDAVIEQAVAEARQGDRLVLTPELQARLRGPEPGAAAASPWAPPRSAPRTNKSKPTIEELQQRLDAHAGNVKALARELGVQRSTIYRWFARAGVELRSD